MLRYAQAARVKPSIGNVCTHSQSFYYSWNIVFIDDVEKDQGNGLHYRKSFHYHLWIVEHILYKLFYLNVFSMKSKSTFLEHTKQVKNFQPLKVLTGRYLRHL